MQAITIGHDSEFGLLSDGALISALDVFDEDVFEDENGRYFADNINCEIAINPVTTLAEFHSKTEGLLAHVRSRGFEPLMQPTIHYPDTCLGHPLARIAGCNPDESAYLQARNEAPVFAEMDGFRSCGGHIHAQLDGANPYWWARWMDAYVGLPLLLEEEPNERRRLYGGAGCMRVKPYGGEYRTLSNVWLDRPDLREFVWEGTHKAVERCKQADPEAIEDWWDIPTAIDTHDTELARRTVDRLYIYGVTNV
jgi:hypothetical protein